MKTTNESTVRTLAQIAETVALEECEAVQAGQDPCPLQYDSRDEWCLSCVAKKAAADYFNG
jgi:hypothetical protein